MWKNDAPRPTFLLPRVLHAAGSPRPFEPLPELPSLLKTVIPDSRAAEGWWSALEPMMLSLIVAGYDSPEIVIGRSDVPGQYLRLLAWQGYVDDAATHVLAAEGDWKTLTGAATLPASGTYVAVALRIRPRSWLEQPLGTPSPFPALPLDGIPFVDDNGVSLLGAYVRGRGPDHDESDPFITPMDGWMTLAEPLVTSPSRRATQFAARAIARRVAEALASAWNPAGTSPLGLITFLNPATWDSPRVAQAPLDGFQALAAEIWTWLKVPANLAWTLTQELRDTPGSESEASFAGLLSRARGAAGQPFDPARLDPFIGARRDLTSRHELFHPGELSGGPIIAGLGRRHWLVLLFILHDYGLIRMLPFGVASPTILPPADAAADLPPVDLTGLYESDWTWPGCMTLHINQAGTCLDGWLTDSRFSRLEFTAALDPDTYKPSAGAEAPPLRFVGVFDGTDVPVEVHTIAWPDDGRPVIDVSVVFESDTAGLTETTMTRRDRRARLRPSLIGETLPDSVVLALDSVEMAPDEPEWTRPRPTFEATLTPLHSLHELGMRLALEALRDDLRTMHAESSGINPPKSQIEATLLVADTTTRMLAQLVSKRVLQAPEVPDAPSPLLHRFRSDAHAYLHVHRVAVGITCWSFLEDVVFVKQPARSATLRELLAVDRMGVWSDSLDMRLHEYDFSISGYGMHGSASGGGVAEAGAFAITCPLQHMSRCAPGAGAHGWPREVAYTGFLLEAAGGVGEGLGVSYNFFTSGNTNTLITRGEWGVDDFVPSTMLAASGSAGASAYVGVGGGGAAPLPPDRAGGLEGTQVELVIFMSAKGRAISEISPNSGWNAKVGVGLGASYSVTAGATMGFLTGMSDEARRPVAVRRFDETSADVALGDFAEGAWRLSDGMRQLLARSGARYRALLESPCAVVRIEGDTSTTDTAPHNDELSWKRSLAAYAWMRALLSTGRPPAVGTSSALAPSADRVSVIGYGKLRALNEGKLKDGVPDPVWRRVKVQINDQVVVFL